MLPFPGYVIQILLHQPQKENYLPTILELTNLPTSTIFNYKTHDRDLPTWMRQKSTKPPLQQPVNKLLQHNKEKPEHVRKIADASKSKRLRHADDVTKVFMLHA